MSYAGVYINLDRSAGRRAAMEVEMARYGLHDRYRRFPGADGNVLGVPTALTDSEMGCLTSHYLVLKEHLDSPTHLHVLEDDAMLSSVMHGTVSYLIASAAIDKYDLLFLDSVGDPFGDGGLQYVRQAKRAYDDCIKRNAQGNVELLRLVRTEYIGASTSYLINRESTRKLLAVYDQALADGAKVPVDLLIRNKGREGALRVGCVFPFLTSVRLDEVETTITGRASDAASVVAINLLRHSFFVERDASRLLALAERLLPPASSEPHQQLLERLLGVYITPVFREF